MKYKIVTKDYPLGRAIDEIDILEDEAIDNYLQDSNFDPVEWLETDEDKIKYCELRNLTGISDFCECGTHEEE